MPKSVTFVPVALIAIVLYLVAHCYLFLWPSEVRDVNAAKGFLVANGFHEFAEVNGEIRYQSGFWPSHYATYKVLSSTEGAAEKTLQMRVIGGFYWKLLSIE
jgi:hypothetical protein